MSTLRERVAMRMAYDSLVLYSSESVEEWWKHQEGKATWRKRADAVLSLIAEDRRALVKAATRFIWESRHNTYGPTDEAYEQLDAALAGEPPKEVGK